MSIKVIVSYRYGAIVVCVYTLSRTFYTIWYVYIQYSPEWLWHPVSVSFKLLAGIGLPWVNVKQLIPEHIRECVHCMVIYAYTYFNMNYPISEDSPLPYHPALQGTVLLCFAMPRMQTELHHQLSSVRFTFSFSSTHGEGQRIRSL